MRSLEHSKHLGTNVSWNNCPECRADTERRFVPAAWPTYRYVHEYLSWSRPRFAAIAAGENSVDSRTWHREWIKALHRRIFLRNEPPRWRKLCDSYLEQLRMAPRGRNADAGYLRTFSMKGASAL